MDFNNLKKRFFWFLGNHFIYFAVMLVIKTLRIKTENYSGLKEYFSGDKNVIAAFWHGTMILPWYFFRNRNFSALVSGSKDGEILARVLKRWGYSVERGSSHKGGKEALETLVRKMKEKFSAAITPDGPTGPPFEMKAGTVVAAKKTGLPLFLIGTAYKKKINLKSWDRFQIPLPFTKAAIVFSEPIFVDENLEYEKVSAIIKETENKLNNLQLRANEIVKHN